LTASVLAVEPVRVTVNTIGSAAPAVSAPAASVAVTVTVGVPAASSSRIVTWPVSRPRVSPTGPVNATVNSSLASEVVSPISEMEIAAVVAPAAKVATPEAAT
jgi:anti-sigma factor RsiW